MKLIGAPQLDQFDRGVRKPLPDILSLFPAQGHLHPMGMSGPQLDSLETRFREVPENIIESPILGDVISHDADLDIVLHGIRFLS